MYVCRLPMQTVGQKAIKWSNRFESTKMSLYLVLTLLLLFEVKISFQEDIENLNEKDCVVKEVKSGLRKPCQFPFIFSNQTFYGCTIFKSDNGNPWCSTKVDPLGREHLSTSLACNLTWPLDF